MMVLVHSECFKREFPARFKRPVWITAVAFFAVVAAETPLLCGQDTALELDPVQTHIEFTLPATMHTVHGTFNLKSGLVRLDPSGKASGRIIVNAPSGNSGNTTRDKKMHRTVLESEKYPEIIFTPDHVDGQIPSENGNFQLSVHGIFLLHGQSHDMTLPVQAVRTRDELTATTHFVIPYVEWGLKNPSTIFLHVSEEVQINARTAGRITATASTP